MDESKSKPETGAVLESVERQPVEPARRRLAAVAAAPPLDGPVRQRLTADPLAFLRRRYGDFARVDCVLFFPSKIHFDSFVNDNGSLSLSCRIHFQLGGASLSNRFPFNFVLQHSSHYFRVLSKSHYGKGTRNETLYTRTKLTSQALPFTFECGLVKTKLFCRKNRKFSSTNSSI